MAMRAPEAARRLLVEMRAQLIDNLGKQISGGDLVLLSSVNGGIAAIDTLDQGPLAGRLIAAAVPRLFAGGGDGEAGQKSPAEAA